MTAPAPLPKPARRRPAGPRDGGVHPADVRHGFPPPDRLAWKGLPPDGTPLTAEQFLALPFDNTRAEWVDGKISYLPMTSELHGAIQLFLVAALLRWREASGVDAAIRMSTHGVETVRRFREPDIVVMRDKADARKTNAIRGMVWRGADFVVEIVSPDNPRRDTERKRDEYAAAGIGEYWIVDPRTRSRTVTVLTADGAGGWDERVFREGETATGEVLKGFEVDVSDCLAGD